MNEPRRPRHVLRRLGALLAGVLANIIPAVATDMMLASMGVLPPLSEPVKFTTPLLLLATAYRTVYGIAAGYLTARLAPDHPMGHALASAPWASLRALRARCQCGASDPLGIPSRSSPWLCQAPGRVADSASCSYPRDTNLPGRVPEVPGRKAASPYNGIRCIAKGILLECRLSI